MLETRTSDLIEPHQEQQESLSFWIASFRDHEGRKKLHLLDKPGHAKPRSAESPSCSVIFDGILYNSNELARDLPNLSSLPSNDAEWIVQAYLHWGEATLQKIKGIFALIIWDSANQRLLCARDPFGVYPLYYADATGELLFSTSVQALVSLPHVSRKLNRAVLVEHVSQHWFKGEETYYSSVRRVLPGHVFLLEKTNRQEYRYWNPLPVNSSIDWVTENELERFNETMDRVISRALNYGPAAIYLSGGIDSVSVAAVAVDVARRRKLATPLALSLGFPSPECNEEALQRRVALDLGLPQVMVPFDEAVGSQGLIWKAIEMSADWPFPLLNVWKPAYHHLGLEARRRGCKVIMTGGGGDEWLTVNPYYTADLIRHFEFVVLYRHLSNLFRSYSLSRLAMLKCLIWRLGLWPLISLYARRIGRWAAPQLLKMYLCRRQRRVFIPTWVAPDEDLSRKMNERLEESVEGQMQKSEPRGRYGFYFDHIPTASSSFFSSMEFEEDFETGRRLGLRLVHPYWDTDLVHLLMRISPEILNKGGKDKGMVRQVLSQRFPGLGFPQHKKVSAASFFQSRLVKEGRIAWEKMGGAKMLVDLGVVDGKIINAIKEKGFSSGNLKDSWYILQLLILEAWIRKHI